MELHGTYWRIVELADKLGVSYNQAHSLIRNEDGLIKLGVTVLIPDSVAQKLISKNSHTPMDHADKVTTMSISEVASSLNMGQSVVYQLIQLGLPIVRYGKKKRVERRIFQALEPVIREYQEQYSCVPEHKIPEIFAKIKASLKQ